MSHFFEPHRNPNTSRLENWREEITAMRSLNWPYRRIAEWLSAEQRLQISKEAVRKFCKVRGINKGSTNEERTTIVPPPPEPRRRSKDRPFLYDEADAEQPIQIRRR